MASPSRREPLSRDRILGTALAIIDAEGLEALSMRRVGTELGVEAMSLYNHVPNKAALLDGVHERILEEMDRPRTLRSWRDYARHQGRALRKVLCAHPSAVTLFATRPATTSAALARLEAHLAVLREAGFGALEALYIVQSVAAFVVGHTLSTVAPREGVAAPAYDTLDRDAFPNVRAVAAVMGRYQPEREFEHGLEALLTGFTPI